MIAPSRSPDPHPFRLAVDINELADGLGVSVRTIRTLMDGRQIPFTYIGERNLRFNLKAVQEWLDAQTTMPAGMVDGGPEHTDDLTEDMGQDVAQPAFPAANPAGRRAR